MHLRHYSWDIPSKLYVRLFIRLVKVIRGSQYVTLDYKKSKGIPHFRVKVKGPKRQKFRPVSLVFAVICPGRAITLCCSSKSALRAVIGR